MSLAPRRSSSPIRKPSRATSFRRYIPRAATYPCIAHPFAFSPNSCFTDDNALEQLLSHSLPTPPSSPHPSRPVPRSPTSSDVTQFRFLLPDPIQPLNTTDTMSHSGDDSNHPSQSSHPNNSNNNNNNNNNNSNNDNNNRNTRHSTANPSNSRSNNRRRRPSNLNNTESTSRRRTTTQDESLRCDICLQYYSRRDNLRAHQRVHTGDRPYQCRFCAQRFRWLGALRNHEAIHERDGDRPLNPPPPLARQPTASSSRQSNPSSHHNTSPRSSVHHRTTTQPQPAPTTDHTAQQPTSAHPSQRISPVQHPSHPNVPNLEFDLDATHGAPNRHVLVTEGEPQVSPLYPSQENWDNLNILDDIPEDRSRD